MEKKVIANNNVPIFYYENEALHRFCLTLYVKGRILYEANNEIGITHCWEHMTFRNINRVLGGEMKQRLDKMGAYFNGCTFKEFVEIKIIAAKEHFSECADIISKVFDDIDISKEEYNIECKRIKSEIREDDEKKSIDYMAQKMVWKDTCLEKSIAGKKSTLSNITMERVREYAKEILTANNIFIYVTGAINDDNIAELSDKVGKYKLREEEEIKDNRAPVPESFYHRNGKVKIKKGDYCSIRYSFDYDAEAIPKSHIDLLYDILFDGECSKIHEELSEKTGYVYSYSSAIEQYSNIGNMYFSYEIDEKNLLKSIDRVVKLLKRLKKGVGEELQFVKPNYVDNGDMDLDEPEKLNWIMGYEGHILEQDFLDINSRKELYKKVTCDDITRLANEIFQLDNLVVSIKVNKSDIKVKDVKKILAKL